MNKASKLPIRRLTFAVVGLATLTAGCLQNGILDEIDNLDRSHHDAGGGGTGGVAAHHDAGVDSAGGVIGHDDSGVDSTGGGGIGGAPSDQHDGGSGGVGQVAMRAADSSPMRRVCGSGLFCDGAFPKLACVLDVSGTCQVKPSICDTLYAGMRL